MDVQFLLLRNMAVFISTAIIGNMHLAIAVSFFISKFCKVARHRIICLTVFFEQVEWNHRELTGCAACQKQNSIVIRNVHDIPDSLFGMIHDL